MVSKSFLVDDSMIEYDDYDESDHDEDDMFDNVCAICDNGGVLICCEGKCLRAFHATKKSAKSARSHCMSLNLSAEELEGLESFICLNCAHEQHQCFVCKELGSSNVSSGAEVFCCSLATCGHFYHPRCVAQLLKKGNDSEARDVEESIAAGEPFTCPAHKCHVCQQEENEKVEDLQFAICRRCPTSYHRKCLPGDILFDSEEFNDADDVTRAWNDLLPKSRALIFCLKHKMDKRLHTAKRDIKFPEIDNVELVKSDITSDDERKVKKSSSTKRARKSSQSEPIKKRLKKRDDSVKKVLNDDDVQIPTATIPMESEDDDVKKVLDDDDVKTPTATVPMESEDDDVQTPTATVPMESEDDDVQTPTATHKVSEDGSFTSLRERISALVKRVRSSVTVDNVKIHQVEESTEAVNLALKKLEEGCSVEDALADCKPDDLEQLWKLKDKLKAYLAPFLDEMLPTEVENRELNCEVEVENTTGKVAASVASQKETSQRDNDKPRTDEKVDGQKEKHKACLPQQSTPSETHRKHGRESLSSPWTQGILERSWVYRDASGFDPRPYDPSRNVNSTAGWLEE